MSQLIDEKNITNISQKYLLKTNKKWFEFYSKYIQKEGKIIHIGNGFGYATLLLTEKNPNVIALDISVSEDTINKEDVILYDGVTIPYHDEAFDMLLCDYVIHHTPRPYEFLNELKRVVKKDGIVVIIEQTYENLFQRIKLIYSCWKQNRVAGQNVKIYPSSYFSRRKLRQTFEYLHLSVIDILTQKRKSSFTEVFILRRLD